MLTKSHVETAEKLWKLLRIDGDTGGCYMAATQQNCKDVTCCDHINS